MGAATSAASPFPGALFVLIGQSSNKAGKGRRQEGLQSARACLHIAKVIVVDGVGEQDGAQHVHVVAALGSVERLRAVGAPHILFHAAASLAPFAPPGLASAAQCERPPTEHAHSLT